MSRRAERWKTRLREMEETSRRVEKRRNPPQMGSESSGPNEKDEVKTDRGVTSEDQDLAEENQRKCATKVRISHPESQKRAKRSVGSEKRRDECPTVSVRRWKQSASETEARMRLRRRRGKRKESEQQRGRQTEQQNVWAAEADAHRRPRLSCSCSRATKSRVLQSSKGTNRGLLGRLRTRMRVRVLERA